MSRRLPEDMPDSMSEHMAGKFLDRMRKGLPKKMQEHMPGRMPICQMSPWESLDASVTPCHPYAHRNENSSRPPPSSRTNVTVKTYVCTAQTFHCLFLGLRGHPASRLFDLASLPPQHYCTSFDECHRVKGCRSNSQIWREKGRQSQG